MRRISSAGVRRLLSIMLDTLKAVGEKANDRAEVAIRQSDVNRRQRATARVLLPSHGPRDGAAERLGVE